MSQAATVPSFGPTIPLHTSEPVVEELGSASMLLKSPQSFARLVAQDRFDLRASMVLLATAFGFCALYGLTMGVFAGGNALWQATLKAPLVIMGSMALCAPSLYLLVSLNGTQLSFRQVTALLAGAACLSGLLMVGFAPVAWLFGVSTSNVPFMVMLHGLIWGIGLGAGLWLLARSVPGGPRANKSLVVWAAIYLVVCAQMLTYFRPVLGVALHGKFRVRERQFFFEHFYASMAGEKPGAAPAVENTAAPAPKPSPAPGFTPAPSAKPVSN